MHKMTTKSFSENIERFRNYVHPKTGEPAPLIAEDVYNVIMEHKDTLGAPLCPCRHYDDKVGPES